MCTVGGNGAVLLSAPWATDTRRGSGWERRIGGCIWVAKDGSGRDLRAGLGAASAGLSPSLSSEWRPGPRRGEGRSGQGGEEGETSECGSRAEGSSGIFIGAL